MLAQGIQLVQGAHRCADLHRLVPSSRRWKPGLAVYKGKPLVNSVTGEEDRLETVLPLVKKYGASVVAISNDETGISRGSGRAFRGGQEDRRTRGRLRHPCAATSWSTRW